MDDLKIFDKPEIYTELEANAKRMGFTMPADLGTGALLKTLISSKPKSSFLELGTGAGLSLSWMIDGMDEASKLTTVDNEPQLAGNARVYFGKDERVEIICADGAEWLKNYSGERFDLIFADAWPGKYSEIEETLALVKAGGFYIVDDMRTRPDWPREHQGKADNLVKYLENRNDFNLVKMNWSSGLILAVKKY
ncbi:class I SAM-dependent methyltransferase [Fulvivirgaceae bacterium BMA12]|uniref:Class I SAM-dependent methyltransferase n=1 Tax=Agaribacillus aureus TaxID=3051825 RepID=A0ABT8LEN5_9BACT|nr:class I SAM-dependent methyltransferase [Fulvivirgaceae bacterium BMA12]